MINRNVPSPCWIVAALALHAFSCGRSRDEISQASVAECEQKADCKGNERCVDRRCVDETGQTSDAAPPHTPMSPDAASDAQAPQPQDYPVDLPDPPVVEPEVSAAYEWKECGRIEPQGAVVDALYAEDDSVLTLWNDGRVERHVGGSNVGVELVSGRGPQDNNVYVQTKERLDLSPDGKVLLRGAEIYRRADGGPVVGAVSPWTVLSLADAPCGNTQARLSGSYAVSAQEKDLCVWALSDGSLSFSVRLPDQSPTWDSAQVSKDRVVAAAGGTLYSYSLAGAEQAAPEAVGSPRPGLFTPDGGRYLGFTDSGLVALDVATGKELWQAPLSQGPGRLALSGDGTRVYVGRSGLFQVADGKSLPAAVITSYLSGTVRLNHSGDKRLNLHPQLSEWDLGSGQLTHQYGSIFGKLDDVEVSRDGTFFATHSRNDRAIVWQTNTDFSISRPVYSGFAPDDSWNVALASNGEALLVSGDNATLTNRAGERFAGDVSSFECPSSAHASFSLGGRWVAGTHYGEQVHVFEAASLAPVAQLEARNCAGGVAFSRDGKRLYTASLAVYEVPSWRELWSPSRPLPAQATVVPIGDRIELSLNGLEALVSTCEIDPSPRCKWGRYDVTAAPKFLANVPELAGMRASYSPESHWVISAGNLVHLPSKTSRKLPGDADEVRTSTFFPNGDIVAGYDSGAVVRYCRQ